MLGTMSNYRRLVPCRLVHRQLILLPKKYFTIKNTEATTLTTTTKHKFIDELLDEINNKILSYMCRKDLLKMKGESNKTGKVVSCNNLVQFKIVMERLHGIINGLKAIQTKNKQKFILRNRVEVGEDRGYIVKITPNLCMLFSKWVSLQLTRPSGSARMKSLLIWGHLWDPPHI